MSASGMVLKHLTLNFHPSTFECVCARVSFSSTSCIHALIYRTGPITAAFFDELSQLLEFFVNIYEPLYVTGDFNIHMERTEDRSSSQLHDIFTSHNFECYMEQPTHVLGGTIDLIFCRNSRPVSPITTVDTGISDHFLLHWKSALDKPPPVYESRTFRPWNKMNISDLRRIIGSSVLCDVNAWSSMNCDELVHHYELVISSALDSLIPFKTIKFLPRKSDPWFDAECRLAKRLLRSIERVIQSSHPSSHGFNENYSIWRTCKQIYRNFLKSKREEFWRFKVQSETLRPHHLWKSINSLLGRGRSPISDCLSATDFQEFFHQKHSSFVTENRTLGSPTFTIAPHDVLFSEFCQVPPSVIASTVMSLPNKQSSLDMMPTRILKECIDLLSPFLSEVVNRSFLQGEFPKRLSIACVTPILKKHCSAINDTSSYRPISNLTVLSKLIERLCFKQLIAHLKSCDLLPVLQSAYRECHSTESVILKLTSDFLSAMDNGDVTLLASLDLSSAFDLVDHEILLKRLNHSFGLSSCVLRWFHSFLSRRCNFYKFRDSHSPLSPVCRGVPQGSVLGPILFVLYTADIIKLVQDFALRVHMFADDIQVYGSCSAKDTSDLSSRMCSCISSLHSWLKLNKLNLNTQKSSVMWIGTKQRLANMTLVPIQVGDRVIQPVSSILCLGFSIDSSLSFSVHVSRTLSACFGMLRQLRSIRRSITRSLAASLVSFLVFPRLEYCCSALSGISDHLSTRLQSVIHASARFVDNLPLSAHISPSLRNLKWQSMKSRIELRLILWVFKCLHNRAPAYLSELLCPVDRLSSRSRLRSASTKGLAVPRHRLKTTSKKAFAACASRSWNKLPSSLKTVSSSQAFKVAAKHFLSENVL